MPYKIVCWISVEPDDPELYRNQGEGLKGPGELRSHAA